MAESCSFNVQVSFVETILAFGRVEREGAHTFVCFIFCLPLH